MLFGWELPVLFASMMLVRFLFGCGEAGAYPNVARIVGAWFPFRERGLALGTVWMCARVGGAIAPVIMGLFTTVIGWQQAFWVLGLVGILWCLVFRPWYRNSPGQMPSCNEAERELIHGSAATATQAAAPERHTFPPLGPILASPSMWALCTAAVFVNLAWYFFPTWQPRYLKDVFGISMKDSEIWTGLPYLCGAIGCLAGGRLSDYLIRVTGSRRWGRALLGLTGFCGAGLCAFCVPLASQAWEAVTLLCLVFFITDLAVPVMWAASTDISGRFAGTITAIVNTAGCIGAFLGPALTGARLQLDTGPSHQTWQLIFTGLAGAWVIAGLCWLFIDASRPIVPQETAPKT